eukprot:g23646.t1
MSLQVFCLQPDDNLLIAPHAVLFCLRDEGVTDYASIYCPSLIAQRAPHCCGSGVPCRADQPAVLDNLLSSMKFVLQGMGILRINLANPKNT